MFIFGAVHFYQIFFMH